MKKPPIIPLHTPSPTFAGNNTPYSMAASKSHILSFHDSFAAIAGECSLTLCLENDIYPFAHEAGIFIPETNELFITSNQYPDKDGNKKIQVSKIKIQDDGSYYHQEINPDVPMANGGINYKNGVLFCAQGDHNSPSGLIYMESSPPYRTTPIIQTFHGRQFNSVNDVVVHSDGSIWFTDPIYGYEQGIRPKPQLPCQTYRFDPKNQSIRPVADGIARPNGICFSPDEKTVYITDTDFIHGDDTTDLARGSSIYAFDVTYYHGEPFLTNRRLFAMADVGAPDGIKCDTNGNVYSGCFDGVSVWSPGGILLGKILVEGGISNFCFGRDGEIFLLNETRLWRAKLDGSVKGALLGI